MKLENIKQNKIAKPFIKWARGKSQLLSSIESVMPKNMINISFTYIEPFIGGGAVLFWILNRYPEIENAIINDINIDLTNSYKTIKNDVDELISALKK